MKGKILFSIVALGAASVALANGGLAPVVAAEPVYFDGFLVGIAGSMQHLDGELKDDVTHGLVITGGEIEKPPCFDPSINSDIGDNTLGGGLSIGYGKVLNSNYYLGGELYARYAHNTIDTSIAGDLNLISDEPETYPGTFKNTMSVESDWSFGGALKLGYLVTPKTMIYLLAGVENSQFDVDVDHSISVPDVIYNGGEDYLPLNWSNKYSFDKNKWAFVPGVGIETMLNDKLSLKAEYTYAWYGSLSRDEINSATFVGADETTYTVSSDDNSKVKLDRGLFSLGLTYHFNGI